MTFENIGGNANTTQYSLYDFSDNYLGETIMSIEFHRESGNWWFVDPPVKTMKKVHMNALQELLNILLA